MAPSRHAFLEEYCKDIFPLPLFHSYLLKFDWRFVPPKGVLWITVPRCWLVWCVLECGTQTAVTLLLMTTGCGPSSWTAYYSFQDLSVLLTPLPFFLAHDREEAPCRHACQPWVFFCSHAKRLKSTSPSPQYATWLKSSKNACG